MRCKSHSGARSCSNRLVRRLFLHSSRYNGRFNMHTKQIVAAVSGIALINAQAPPVSTLSTTMSGVLPVLPVATGFTGVETIEEAIAYDGPVVDGFTGWYPLALFRPPIAYNST